MSRMMTVLGVLFCTLYLSPARALAVSVFINEIHYDNSGADINEAVELAGIAGSSIDGWQLVLYNGSNGSVYQTHELQGLFDDQSNGYGFLSFDISGMQNGSPDGLALVTAQDVVSEFISYEGEFNATNGPADGLLSVDIGIAESSATAIGSSLFLAGEGNWRDDFYWKSGEASLSELNNGQVFQTERLSAAIVPLPASWSLMLLPLAFLLTRKRFLKPGRNLLSV